MAHALARMVIGSPSEVRLTETEYEELKVARDAVLELLFAEEKYDLVVQNYLEFETELLGTTVQNILTNATDWQWFQSKRGLLNRRLVNLLSAARGYIDHFGHVVHVLFGRDSPRALASMAQLSRHYDSCLGYRVLDALRNYTQHRGFPIHALELSSKLLESEPRNRFKFGIAVYTKTSYLREEKKFKAAVLEELDNLGGRVDLKPLVRDYVAALAESHESLRVDLTDSVALWEGSIEAAIERFRSAFPSEPSLKGLAAVVIDGQRRTGEVPLFSEFIQYRRHLALKNSGLKRLGVFYASGETISRDIVSSDE